MPLLFLWIWSLFFRWHRWWWWWWWRSIFKQNRYIRILYTCTHIYQIGTNKLNQLYQPIEEEGAKKMKTLIHVAVCVDWIDTWQNSSHLEFFSLFYTSMQIGSNTHTPYVLCRVVVGISSNISYTKSCFSNSGFSNNK